MLYLPNLRISPSWYGDEILTLEIGKSLARGRMLDGPLYCTFFAPRYPYQPGFAFLTGVFANLSGGDIVGGRFFSSLIGLLTALTGFYFISRKRGFLWGCLFAFMLLGYSQSIIHYRWIYPHNAVGLAALGAAFILMRPANKYSDWKAGGFLAIAAGSHLLSIHATATAILCRIKRPSSWLPIGWPPALILVTSLFLAWFNFHEWLFEDLKSLNYFYMKYSADNGAGIKKFLNFGVFFIHDPFHILALIGCLLCLRRRSYIIAIFAFGLTFLLTQNRQNLPLFYYQAMIVLPVLVAGTILGLHFFTTLITKLAPVFRRCRRLIPILLILICILNALSVLPIIISGKINTRITPWVVSSTRDYEEAANWINSHTKPDDFVIVYNTLGWKLRCHWADVITATAWAGYSGADVFSPPPLHERFLWYPDFKTAKFFILTDLDRAWALSQGSTMQVVQSAGITGWPVVYSCGTTTVLANPLLN